MIIFGYTLALIVGLTLGMVGAGGSILTVPILVYALDVKPVIATSYSLLIVGSAAMTGAYHNWKHGHVDTRAAIIFVIPALITVLITRVYIIHNIPDPLLHIPKDIYIMLLFAILMIFVACFMLKTEPHNNTQVLHFTHGRIIKLICGSSAVGFITGMIGAGGSFMIIPTLIALFGLSMKKAIGTSLVIVTINSLIGFKSDVATGLPLDWHLLAIFLGITLIGMWTGTHLGDKINAKKLKTLFAGLTLLVGTGILIKEITDVLTMHNLI